MINHLLNGFRNSVRIGNKRLIESGSYHTSYEKGNLLDFSSGGTTLSSHGQRAIIQLSARACLTTLSNSLEDRQEVRARKLMYEGKLSKRILYLKGISISSSIALASSYGYVLSQKSFTVALAGVGCVFTPFLLSPFFIAWFFKRYVTELYYNYEDETYTAHHYGLFLNKKSLTFKREDVIRSDVTSMLNTFKVKSKPFFLHDEDLLDIESVELYTKMIGVNIVKEAKKLKYVESKLE